MLLNFNYTVITIVGLGLHYFIFFSLLKIKRVGKCLASLFAVAPLFVYSASLFVFNYKMDRSIVASGLENEGEMILYFVSPKLISMLIFFWGIMYFLISKIKYRQRYDKLFFIGSTFIVVTATLFAAITKNRQYLFSYPIVDCFDLLSINKVLKGFELAMEKRDYERNADELRKLFKYEGADDLNVVLIIGESARADYFGKYAVRVLERNIINLKKSISGYRYTRDAVPEILTLVRGDKNYSITDIMNALGFNTFWIGAQGIKGATESPYAHFALNSKNRIYKDSTRIIEYDMELLGYLDKLMATGGKNFYIIHQIGSHTPFFKRFERGYEKYDNYCKSKDMLNCSEEDIHNAYVNSIVYTDIFLDDIMRKFEGKNTLLFYTSDHGVDNIYLNKDEGRQVVPAFFWTSGNVNALDVIALTKINFNHKMVVESVLECAGIKSELINEGKLL
jgi:glucan phosphoethanolaminetransferase (alkaline phosphatase superfamily)